MKEKFLFLLCSFCLWVMEKMVVNLWVSSWRESGPWSAGSRMTSPSSNLNRQINFNFNLSEAATRLRTRRFLQTAVTRMPMTELPGNPQQQQVCVDVYLFSAESFGNFQTCANVFLHGSDSGVIINNLLVSLQLGNDHHLPSSVHTEKV